MSILEILLLGIGLSMDAFAVSICKGLSTKKLQVKHYLIIGAWFGGFQALMPTIGYFLGSTFEQYITAFDHWVAFVLLAAIGANMIKESFSKEESETSASFAFKTMLLMALATSIDAHGGYAMKNIYDRIRLYYGADYGLAVQSSPGCGTKVVFCIPHKNWREK